MTAQIQSIDPASGDVIWKGEAATAEAVTEAVRAARVAFADWRTLPLSQRIEHVRAFRAALERRAGDVASVISRETGKPGWEARAEVASMIAKVETSISAQAVRAGEKHNATDFGEAVLRHRPHGVMAVLGPYNFPGHLPNGHIVPALLAGNCVVFKPSELTPMTGEVVAKTWNEAGLPDNVFTLVQGGHETGSALTSAKIDGLLFTGSATTGALLRRQFADRPDVILALELGGNNPLIVWDGDVREAASVVVQSAFVTTGQRCSCARRLIVPDTPFGEEITAAVAGLCNRLVIGAWNETPAPYMGPLISTEAAAKAMAQVRVLLERGAREIVPFAHVPGRTEAFVTPAMFDVTGLDVPDEEIFAPVLQVVRVADFDAALTAANDTRFGLTAGLVTGEDALWQRFAIEARAGVINRNRPTTGASGAMPFGGIGASGNHRPSAFYAADYCAYPVASFEATTAQGNLGGITGMVRKA